MPQTCLSIVFLGHPQSRTSGDWLHRAYWPAEELGAHANVHLVQTTHSEWLSLSLAADVLVVLMLVDPLLLDVIARRREHKRVTVYEISDDFKAFQVGNAQRGYYSQPHVQQLIESLANAADAVQYSSAFLQRKYAYLNPVSRLLRNQLAAGVPLTSTSTNCDRPLIVGWSGSAGHQRDVTELSRWLAAWPNRRQVIWRVMAAPALVDVFTQAGLTVERVSTGSMEHYLAFLGGLDVSLIWAGNDDFSRGRSDGKFLESASQGAAVLCRRSEAYEGSIEHGVTGLFFETEQELYAHLDQFVQAPVKAWEMGLRAQTEVQQYRTHAYAAFERLDFYSELTSFRTGIMPQFVNCVQEFTENLLYEALTHHRNGDLARTLVCAVQVMERGVHSLLLWQLLQDTSMRLGREEDAALCEQRGKEWLAERRLGPHFSLSSSNQR